MTAEELICPICKSRAKALDKTGDATGFHCERHDNFKVADTIFALPSKLGASADQWETALKKAKARAKPGEWPVIHSDDFP